MLQWLVYVRHPDETSMLIEAVADQEEAIALCHDLVVVDGYERAEIWSEDGERLYCLERREGASLRTMNDLDRSMPLRLRTPDDVAPPADEHDALGVRRDDLSAGNGRRAEPSSRAPETRAPELPRILGEQPGHEERWLGL